MTYMHITISAYFLTGGLNWLVLWAEEKYFLNSVLDKLKNMVSSNKCKQ